MSTPTRTPNPATITRPERSSRRVAHKKPLAWLPWAALAALALLAALVFLAIHALADDGPDRRPADTSSRQGTQGTGGGTGNGTASGGAGAGAGSTGGAAGLGALTGGALVGGAGIAPAQASADAATAGKRTPGTAGTVLFAESSAALDSAAQQVVTTAANNLKAAGAKSVEVIGYTDIVAGAPVNGPLSQQRADATAAALRTLLPGVNVTTSARGQDEPVATNDSDAGRQQNRRAAIIARG